MVSGGGLTRLALGDIDAIHCDAATALEGVEAVLTATELDKAGMSNKLGGLIDITLWQENLLASSKVSTFPVVLSLSVYICGCLAAVLSIRYESSATRGMSCSSFCKFN